MGFRYAVVLILVLENCILHLIEAEELLFIVVNKKMLSKYKITAKLNYTVGQFHSQLVSQDRNIFPTLLPSTLIILHLIHIS